MTLIQTADLRSGSLSPSHTHQTYCGLDNCLVVEVREELSSLFNTPPHIYDFERELQGPYLEIMLRGFLVDGFSRAQASQALHLRAQALTSRLNLLAQEIWSRPLIRPGTKLPHFTILQEFFYEKMHLPEVWISQKGERKLSTNREALERLDSYIYARPFVAGILRLREIYKQLSVFEEEVDPDSRHRSSYNITGTETGRPSSSENAFGTGGNAQNVAPGLRYVFIADRGKKLGVIDLEQVEARDVGFFCGCLFNDWSFLDACESGDLHTSNAKRIWPELPWTGDAQGDRKIADQLFYRDFTYRDMAKRGSHLSNYSGTAWTASRALKVPLPMMEEFQARYVRGRSYSPAQGARPSISAIEPAFPCIPRWWRWTAQELETRGWLETPFGRRRHFFGRAQDDTTLREAIAFLPQSTTADRMNLGLWRVWKKMPQLQLLAQTYDSITFQFDEALSEDALIEEALELIRIELRGPNDRSYIVPGEAKTGWNWGNVSEKNPLGLRKCRRGFADERSRPASFTLPSLSLK